MNLPEKVKASIAKHSMLSGGETVLVGLSGGADSVCLLYILKKLESELGISLHALYIDHGLRPDETPSEIDFCSSLCRRLRVPFSMKRIDAMKYSKEQKKNKQEAARHLRYMAFEESAFENKATLVALGHTADDQAETLIIRLLGGTGTKGLSGIPPVRKNIIRPLIETQRGDIEKFLEKEGIGFVTDSSNLERQYLRNRIRFSIIPLLKELNPNFVKTASITAEILNEEEKYLELLVTKALMKLITRKSDEAIELFIAPLETLDKALLRRVIRRAVGETKGLRGISFINIEDILKLIKTGRAGDRLYLPRGIRVIKKYSTVLLTSKPPQRLRTYELGIPEEVLIKEAGVLVRASVGEGIQEGVDGKKAAVFDADRVLLPLTVRARMPGDFFYPSGFGKRKKIQDYFVDEKVPRDERDVVPLVLSGQDIVWVAGYRADERFRANEGTKRLLLLELLPAG